MEEKDFARESSCKEAVCLAPPRADNANACEGAEKPPAATQKLRPRLLRKCTSANMLRSWLIGWVVFMVAKK